MAGDRVVGFAGVEAGRDIVSLQCVGRKAPASSLSFTARVASF